MRHIHKICGIVVFVVALLFLGVCIVLFGDSISGTLSWKVEEWRHKKEVELEHDNLFEDGVEGILSDLNEALELPEELYITDQFQVTFDAAGTIQSIDTFIYGKDKTGEKKTYLIDYEADGSGSMTVWTDGNTNGEYENDLRLSPMLEILETADWMDQVKQWTETSEEQQIYELLYFGRRSFNSDEGLRYVPGDADGDGVNGTNNLVQLRNGGEIVGFEVSLHIPESDSVTPVRYIMEPEYISQEKLDQENTTQQIEEAKAEESWTTDPNDGTMYFFINDSAGWRLTITGAAAGSRFYVLEKTVDGGNIWECINEDPFSRQLGIAEGLLFFDENFGTIGLTGASQSGSALYITRDGGITFEEIILPMGMVTELPESAQDYGFTVEDYDYLNMPEKEETGLTITVTSDAAESDGIVFQSIDDGVTWEYKGPTQKMD